jgi:hypothetical protein
VLRSRAWAKLNIARRTTVKVHLCSDNFSQIYLSYTRDADLTSAIATSVLSHEGYHCQEASTY